MATSSGIWVPYATAAQPISFYNLPEWDSIMINGMVLPIEGIPKYTRELGLDKKKGAGTDYYALTSKGIKPSEIHITLKLWIDYLTGINYLDMYRRLIPQLIAPRLDKRYSIPIYHPALVAFGVTSAVFAKVPTPQHVGGLIFHVELEAVDGRDAKAGSAKKEKPKPDTNALGSAAQSGATRGALAVTATLGGQAIVTTGGQTITSAFAQSLRDQESAGTFTAEQFQTKVNTPATRSTNP